VGNGRGRSEGTELENNAEMDLDPGFLSKKNVLQILIPRPP
jgi:hypothetical protein